MRRHLARLSPAHRRWRALLASCTAVPEQAGADPAPGNVIICGSPRSGTALAAAALCQEPRALAVMEPWDALRMPPAALFASLHDEIATGVLTRGRLDLPALRDDGRVVWTRDAEKPTPVDLDPDGVLAVKFPTFWQYLDQLPHTKFIVCVRHPVEVVESYGKAGGRLAEGLDYDLAFNASLNRELLAATDDPALRRVLLFDRIHETVLAHQHRPEVYLLRYERWFTERDQVMIELGEHLDTSLGQPPVRISPPRSVGDADTDQASMVRNHCKTAGDLGYDL